MQSTYMSAQRSAKPADSVLLQRKCSCSEKGESCERCNSSSTLARSASNAAVPGGVPPSVHRVLDSPGQQLDVSTRGMMESRFSRDFSHVRIHADSEANRSASAVNASAYTMGNHIAFASDRYRPGDPQGQMLLAHELTHVVQQGGTSGELQRSPDGDLAIQDDDGDEDEADVAAEAVSIGFKVNVPTKKSPTGLAKAPPYLGGAAGGCGICYRGNVRQVGIDVHDQIQTVMRAMYPQLLTNFVIQPKKMPKFLALDPSKEKGLSKTLKKAKGIFKRLIPDLIMKTPTGFAVGEIKPANPEGAFEGEAKLQLYEHFLNQKYKGVIPGLSITRLSLIGPPILPYLDPLAITCRQSLLVNPPIRGLYTYLCYPAFSNELRQKCQCVGDPPKGQDKVTKATNKGGGISIKSSGASAYSAGIGVSIYSSSVGVGNAGVGVSIMSDSMAGGTASVGASVASSGQAVGSIGAGGSYASSSTGAGTAGVGASSSSTAKAVGTAGAGTTIDSDVKAAGVAGTGTMKDSEVTATVTVGSGKTEDATGSPGDQKAAPANADNAGSASQSSKQTTDVEGKATTGTAGTAPGATQTGTKTGTGTGSGAGTKGADAQGPGQTGTAPGDAKTTDAGQTGGKPGDAKTADAGQAGKQPGDAKGADTGAPGDASGGGAVKSGSDLLTEKEMAAFGLKGKPFTHDQLNAALEQARLIRKLIDGSSAEQQALLRAVANNAPDGQYTVPASEWIEKMLFATKGMSKEEIAYLKTLNWRPAKVSAEELRKSVLAALAKKPKTPPKDEGKAGVDKQGAGKAEGQGEDTGGKAGDKGTAKPGGSTSDQTTSKPGVKGGEVTAYRISTDQTASGRDFWFVNFDNFDVRGAKEGQSVPMTLAFFAEDKGIYTFKLKFTIKKRSVSTETKKEKGKDVSRKIVTYELEGANDDRWDIAPQGTRPFILQKNVAATFRGYL